MSTNAHCVDAAVNVAIKAWNATRSRFNIFYWSLIQLSPRRNKVGVGVKKEAYF